MRRQFTFKSARAIVATLAVFAIADAELVSADEVSNQNNQVTQSATEVTATSSPSEATDEVAIDTTAPAEFTAEISPVEVAIDTTAPAEFTAEISPVEAVEENQAIPTSENVVDESAVEETLTTTGATAETTAVESNTITIAHTNDIHGRLEQEDRDVAGIANAAGYFEEVDADVVVDSGDAFQGLPLSNHDSGQAMAEAMNEAGYDAMTVGNHEFDFGFDTATSYEDVTGFPVVSSNVTKGGESVFQPSTNIATDNGYNIGVVGATTPETATKTHPRNVEGITFEDPLPAVVRELQNLVTDTTISEDAFIVLAHLGVDPVTNIEWQGTYLADQLDQQAFLDGYQVLVIDGHSHTAFPEGETFGNVLYAQTGTALNNVGIIEFDPSQPGSAQAQLVTADEVNTAVANSTKSEVTEKVSNIQSIVDDAAAVYSDETSAIVVENNPVWLNGVREYVRSHETNMGNLITDVMVDYGRSGGFNNSTDFAMINGGGIREQIKADQPMTEGDVIAVLPFGNIISQIEVTGNQIYEMFELSYSAPEVTEPYQSSDDQYEVPTIDPDSGLPSLSAAGGFLQVSDDVKVYFDQSLDVGSRVLGVYLKDQITDEFLLVPQTDTDVYYMSTNDFLAQGGDGYTMLSGSREEGPSLDQVVIDALSTQGDSLLTQYADPLPQKRILPITTANYNALLTAEDDANQGNEDNNDNTNTGNNQDLDGSSNSSNPTVQNDSNNTDSAGVIVNDDSNNNQSGMNDSVKADEISDKYSVSEDKTDKIDGTNTKSAAVALPNAGLESNSTTTVLGLSIITLGSVLVVVDRKRKNA